MLGSAVQVPGGVTLSCTALPSISYGPIAVISLELVTVKVSVV